MAKHEDDSGDRLDDTPMGTRSVERQRIAKLMARAGLCSRRDAESWIVEGRVSVNGEVLTSPARDIGPRDEVMVDGAPLPAAEKTRLFLFHKPRGLVTSDHDPEGRRTVFDHLAESWPEGPRVVTVGRLDINTEGLLLLTNDGGLARVLELPQTGWTRRYRVRAKGITDQGVLDGLREGVTVDGMDYAGIEAVFDRAQGANCWLTMGLREGKNREVKRVLEHIGLEVNRLIRLSFGPFQLGELPEGGVAEVRTRVLRDQLGEALAAQAGVDFRIAEEVTSPPRETDGGPRKADGQRAGPSARPTSPGRRAASPTAGRAPPAPTREGRPARARTDERDDAPPAKRQRPTAGPRRHVSALRAASPADDGPRRRLERTSTRDAHERIVNVERVQRVRQPDTDRGQSRPRVDRSANATPSGRAAQHAGKSRAPDRDARRPPERGASPSALAKRERVLRSGGEAAPRGVAGAHGQSARGQSARGQGVRDERQARGEAAREPRPRPADGRPSLRGDGAQRRAAPRRTGEGERPSDDVRARGAKPERSRNTASDGQPRSGAKPRDRQERNGSGGDKPKRAGAERAGPGRGGPGRGGPGRGSPSRGGPGRGGPERAGPGRAAPERDGAPRKRAEPNGAGRSEDRRGASSRPGSASDRPPSRGKDARRPDSPPGGGKPAGRPRR